jgi:hypothetical protein
VGSRALVTLALWLAQRAGCASGQVAEQDGGASGCAHDGGGGRGDWVYATAQETRARLARAGFSIADVSTEPAPTSFDSTASFREFVTKVILRDDLSRLPDDATRMRHVMAFVEASATIPRRPSINPPEHRRETLRKHAAARHAIAAGHLREPRLDSARSPLQPKEAPWSTRSRKSGLMGSSSTGTTRPSTS